MTFNEIVALPALFNILDNPERAAVARLNTICSAAFRSYENDQYLQLKNLLSRIPGVIYLSDKEGKVSKEPLLIALAEGGCKKAIALPHGRALLIPNMTHGIYSGMWGRVVKEECAMSDLLGRLQILSPEFARVMISFSQDQQGLIPAYVCNSFESLTDRGWKIIDCKNPRSCSWIEKKDYIFASDEERFSPENWDCIVDELLNDVAKMCRYQIRLGIDSANLAVVKKEIDGKDFSFQLRWFGFDFSSKCSLLKLPSLDKRADTLDLKAAGNYLSHFLGTFFHFEFPGRAWSEECQKLRSEIVERNKNKICERAKFLILQPNIQMDQ